MLQCPDGNFVVRYVVVVGQYHHLLSSNIIKSRKGSHTIVSHSLDTEILPMIVNFPIVPPCVPPTSLSVQEAFSWNVIQTMDVTFHPALHARATYVSMILCFCVSWLDTMCGCSRIVLLLFV